MQSCIECVVWVLYLLSYISCAQISVLTPSEVFLINALSAQSLKVNDQLLQDHPSKTFKRKRTPTGNITVTKPEIYFFRVQSDIRYRYSRTHFTSQVVNQNDTHSQEVIFSVILPETAFISKFVMDIDGTTYKAFVKERDDGKKIYNAAVKRGQSAGLVELTARHSNVFNVNINVKPNSKVTFNLMYEDLLRRKLGRYEQIININPLQVSKVKDLQMVVNIHESQNITFLRMISFPNDNEAQDESQGDSNKDAVIARPVGNKAHISWSPSIEDESSSVLQGIPEKFLVQYDISLDSKAGQILIMEDHFVHFFAPTRLKAVPKHVILVLDVSGSMKGRKLEQVKESQKEILLELSSEDFFNIITFASEAVLWCATEMPQFEESSPWAASDTDFLIRNQPIAAKSENIEKAIEFIDSLYPIGGTNIHAALETALNLSKAITGSRDGVNVLKHPYHSTVLPTGVESRIILLTDGMPTAGIESQAKIQSLINVANRQPTVPIFSMAFGKRTDFHFLRKLSLQNNGFARKIYESSDAAFQIKEVYNEMSSLLLSNLTFHYTSSQGTISDITLTKFPTYFNGTEIIVAGKFIPKENYNPNRKHILNVSVEGLGKDGILKFANPETLCEKNIRENFSVHDWMPRPEARVAKTDRFFERLWAYLTIKQLIDEDSIVNIGNDSSENSAIKNENPKQQALRLAVQYSFVTPLTCLVVVKPNSSDLVAAPESVYVDKPGSGLFGWNAKSSRPQKSNVTKSIPKIELPIENGNKVVAETTKYSESAPKETPAIPSTEMPIIPDYSDSADSEDSEESESSTVPESSVTAIPDEDSSKPPSPGTQFSPEQTTFAKNGHDIILTTLASPASTVVSILEERTPSPIPSVATTTAKILPPPLSPAPPVTLEPITIREKDSLPEPVAKPEELPPTDEINRSNMMKVAAGKPGASKAMRQLGESIHVLLLINILILLGYYGCNFNVDYSICTRHRYFQGSTSAFGEVYAQQKQENSVASIVL